jgi:hypothetical protein
MAAVLAIVVGTAAMPATAGTYAFALSGSGFTGNGTITASGSVPNIWPCGTCAAGPGELVTGITGSINGDAITALLPPGYIFGNNNHIYPGSGPFLDWGDLGFAAGAFDYNAFQGDFAGRPGYFLAQSGNGDIFANPVSFTLTAVPEPASWALMLVGFGAVGMALRAPRRSATVTA